MADEQWLAERFEEERGRLRAVAYRMLGSLAEADDAVRVGRFVIRDGRIVEVDLIADPERLAHLELSVLED